MSIFKTKWIILKIKKLEEKKILYTIFSYDYWKILCNKKFSSREKSLDLWYLINFEIDVKQGKNIFNIKNIKIKSQFESIWKSYSTINSFLELLNLVNKKLVEKLANFQVFETLEKIINYKNINSQKILLSQLKILNLLWLLNIEHKNITIKKILYFINKNKIYNILKLTWITTSIEQELKKIVEKY